MDRHRTPGALSAKADNACRRRPTAGARWGGHDGITRRDRDLVPPSQESHMQATYRRTPWTTTLAACALAGSGLAFAGEALPEELPLICQLTH